MISPLLKTMQFLWIFHCVSKKRYWTGKAVSPTNLTYYRKFHGQNSALLNIISITSRATWNICLNFDFQEMVTENKLILKFDTTKKARFGVLPRYAKDELQIRWFELPSCFIFHNGLLLSFAILFMCQNVEWVREKF